MTFHLRKRFAQAGVLAFIVGMGAPIPPIAVLGDRAVGVLEGSVLAILSGGLLLAIAALLPEPPKETWGSLWPLVGYDNAVDSLYVRGPWWLRFQELDEAEAEERISSAMGEWFQQPRPP